MDNRCTVRLALLNERSGKHSDLGYIEMDPALCKPNVIFESNKEFYMFTDSPQFYVGESGNWLYAEVVHYESLKNILRQIPGQEYMTIYSCLLSQHQVAIKAER